MMKRPLEEKKEERIEELYCIRKQQCVEEDEKLHPILNSTIDIQRTLAILLSLSSAYADIYNKSLIHKYNVQSTRDKFIHPLLFCLF